MNLYLSQQPQLDCKLYTGKSNHLCVVTVVVVVVVVCLYSLSSSILSALVSVTATTNVSTPIGVVFPTRHTVHLVPIVNNLVIWCIRIKSSHNLFKPVQTPLGV